jgi:hypothetical protein
MTPQELLAKIDIISTQTIDLILATVEKYLGVNKGSMNLSAGSHPILFTTPYDEGINWQFTSRTAIANGTDIGLTFSNPTRFGFTVTVDEACTFEYVTICYNNFISD